MDKIDPVRDIAALAAYQPRQAAIQMIIDGRIDDYLSWAQGEGFFAAWGKLPDNASRMPDETTAMPLDAALIDRIEDYADKNSKDRIHWRKKKLLPLEKAFQTVPYFRASPLEIALRSGNIDSLNTLMKHLSSPGKRLKEGRLAKRGIGWSSLNTSRLILGKLTDKEVGLAPLIDWLGSNSRPPLVMLACLLGNFEAAALIQRYGWAPDREFVYADLSDPLYQTNEAIVETPRLEDKLATLINIPKGNLEKAANWLSKRGQMARELDDLFDEQAYARIRESAFALLDEGAPVSYYPLGVATEQNDLEMLRRLFDAGGDPNAVYKTGWSMLGRLDSNKLSPEALQIWLDRGASPIKHIESDSPYDLSALAEWSWEGRLDLIRQAVDQAAGPVPLTYERPVKLEDNGPEIMKTFAPMLATAMSKGHLDLAVWLIRDKGLSLDYWDNWDDGQWEPCHTFATPEFLAKVRAALTQ